ncbi:hypothetical protein BpHYR1_027073 [Brachionus plicatilis]|uniref:Uncharacterized protein n=1 Tax=Brachionus plicatilis TaxID=10195 RepID=A0A3M7PEE9_BRAPC|nr:hypothetical protein BpHYR1_027073 [Brachionus plicatilis]
MSNKSTEQIKTNLYAFCSSTLSQLFLNSSFLQLFFNYSFPRLFLSLTLKKGKEKVKERKSRGKEISTFL